MIKDEAKILHFNRQQRDEENTKNKNAKQQEKIFDELRDDDECGVG